MIKLLGLLFAIILHAPSFVQAHALLKRDLPLLADTDRHSASDVPKNIENLWLRDQDDQDRYFKDSLRDADNYPPSKLLSSLIDDLKVLGKPSNPEIQLSQESPFTGENLPQFEEEREKDEGGEEKDKEDDEDEDKTEREPQESGEQEASREKKGEESKERRDKGSGENYNKDEYRKKYEEKYMQKPDKRLFVHPEQQLRENLEQLKNKNYGTVQFEEQVQPQKEQNAKVKDENPKISRVEKPPATHFSYIHPEEWSLDSPECSGRHQSPVNLDSKKLIVLDVPSSLVWNGYWNQPQNMTIIDNGHSVELSGTWDARKVPFISGGPLEDDYLFAQLHFHWGPEDSLGSEHTINNRSFPMEMHMVHYKREYGTFSNALKHDDGLAVVGFLFEISETVNFGVNYLGDGLSRIQNNPGIRISVKPYPLAFLHFVFHEDYVYYIGSLTTPPCREIVTWIVSSIPLTISREQLESFREISNKWPEKENHRPQQALNDRRLYYITH